MELQKCNIMGFFFSKWYVFVIYNITSNLIFFFTTMHAFSIREVIQSLISMKMHTNLKELHNVYLCFNQKDLCNYFGFNTVKSI